MSDAIQLTIDGRAVDVQPGQTVLDAARHLGLDIPTLCYLEKCGPLTSCLACVVKINGKVVPSCATVATQGMVVESETDEIREARRTAMELLLSDHVGDCLSPCQRLCPLGLEIPRLIRDVQRGDLAAASVYVDAALPLPGALSRLCHAPCENGCRRGTADQPVAIRDLERTVADFMAESPPETYPDPLISTGLQPGECCPKDASAASAASTPGTKPLKRLVASSAIPTGLKPGANETGQAATGNGPAPSSRPASEFSVAIIGGGPTGLAAAFTLARAGHRCTVVDRNPRAGGSLLRAKDFPSAVLDADLARLQSLGLEFKFGMELGGALTIEGLLRGFDAVLIATGELTKDELARIGALPAGNGIKINDVFQTNVPSVFAAGSVVKPVKHLVRAMADGVAAAECIHQSLTTGRITRAGKPFSSIMGRLEKSELTLFLKQGSPSLRLAPGDVSIGCSNEEACAEALRCVHCDCRAAGDCRLQHYSAIYGADQGRFREGRRLFEQHRQHSEVIYEPGKCIRCGICVRITEMSREPLGLTFIGRGFDVQVAAPMDETISEGLQKTARACVEGCPTGALVQENGKPHPSS